jgi:hypothetical protein
MPSPRQRHQPKPSNHRRTLEPQKQQPNTGQLLALIALHVATSLDPGRDGRRVVPVRGEPFQLVAQRWSTAYRGRLRPACQHFQPFL